MSIGPTHPACGLARLRLVRGQQITTADAQFNPYYEQLCDIHHVIPVDGVPRPILEFFRSQDAAHFTSVELATQAANVLHTYVRLVREMEYENVRRRSFKGLPSRTRCVWVADSLQQARYWLGRVDKKCSSQIVRVAVEGITHAADGRHLSNEACSLSELRRTASAYWHGIPTPNSEPEILVEGSITVLEVVERGAQ